MPFGLANAESVYSRMLDIAMKEVDRNQMREKWRICLLESMVKEVWSLYHQSDLGGHRGLEGTLNKFLKGFFLLSARQKICLLNGGCDTCLTKERSMPARTGVQVLSLAVYVCRGEALCGSSLHFGYNERKPVFAHGGG